MVFYFNMGLDLDKLVELIYEGYILFMDVGTKGL
jgi:hypothetical protein